MVQSGLVGWWPLHEWSGQANDLSGNDNHGTLNNTVIQGTAAIGGLTGYNTDSGGHVSASNVTDVTYTQDYTMSIWVRPLSRESGGNAGVFYNVQSSSDRNLINLDDGEFRAGYYDGSAWSLATAKPKLYEWQHLVLTNRNGNVELYFNGEPTGKRSTSTASQANAAMTIGAKSDGSAEFHGDLADARLYNRALSASEIQHLYEVGSVDVATPPGISDSAAVSRWSFDDRSDTSTALDEWGSNDGTINGATYSADAIRGLSLDFEANSSDYVDTGRTADTSVPFTVSAWVNPENVSNQGVVIGKGATGSSPEHFLQVTSTNEARMGVYGTTSGFTTAVGSGNISLDSWHHIAGSYNGSEIRVFVNGVRLDETTFSESLNSNTDPVTIGRASNDNLQWDGEIDDARLYERQLSDYEVQQLYQWGTMGVDRRYEVIRQ